MPGGFSGDQYSCVKPPNIEPRCPTYFMSPSSVHLIINDRVLPSREERVTSLFRNVGPNGSQCYSTFRNDWKVGLDLPFDKLLRQRLR